jgi:hypothetical protein
MSDHGSNGHNGHDSEGTFEARVLNLERDSAALAAGDRVILGRLTGIIDAENARHADLLRMINRLVESTEAMRLDLAVVAAAVETVLGRIPEKRARKVRA